MGWRRQRYGDALGALNRTVEEAVAFFSQVDEQLSDGYQSTRHVLAHLVFWHREYASIARALAYGREPELRIGPFSDLNAEACREFAREPLSDLVVQLAYFQRVLDRSLRRLPDWRIHFPAKAGGKLCSVEERIPNVEAHIRSHVAALRKAQRAAGSAHSPEEEYPTRPPAEVQKAVSRYPIRKL